MCSPRFLKAVFSCLHLPLEMNCRFERMIFIKISGHHSKAGQWPERLCILLVLFLMKFRVITLHLVCKCALRTTEGFRDLAVRDFRIVEAHLNDAICIRIKLSETCDETLQQVTVSNNIFYRRSAVRNVIAEGTVAIRERLIKRSGVWCVILAQITLSVAFPEIAMRAHAATMILLALLCCPDIRVESTVLFLCDRGECDLKGILRVTKWIETLIIIVFLGIIHYRFLSERKEPRERKAEVLETQMAG
nr:MAG TPA: hypothetical protein [Caudoviricetes sp.]